MVDRLIAIDTEKASTEQLPLFVRQEIDALWVEERDSLQVHKAGAESITGSKTFVAKTFTHDVEVAPAAAGGTAKVILNNGSSQLWEVGCNAAGQLTLRDATGSKAPLLIDPSVAPDAALRILASIVAGTNLDMAGFTITNVGNVNVANGFLQLDGNGRVPTAQLTVDAMQWKGTWNASTNTPTLADGTGSAGDTYRVTVAGTRDLGSGSQTFDVGDWVILSETSVWQKADMTDAVASVAGLTGAISASGLRTALSLVIGTNVQAWDADLDAIAALTTTTYGRSLITLADAAAGRTALGARALVTRITATGTATPAWSWDTTDQFNVTATTAITSMSSGITGTPTDGQPVVGRFKDDGTARAITWGASWKGIGVALPTTTIPGKFLYVGGKWSTADSMIHVLGVSQE